jgi:hypothetical protein
MGGSEALTSEWGPIIGWGFVSLAIGGLAGVSEIVSRYRDEPMRATFNRYGISYLLLNGLASVAAYGLMIRYPTQIFAAVSDDRLMASIVAGFGAMALLRSKLFIFRADDGKDYPIGPSIVIETFLRMLDRKIDRLRASFRQKRVFDQMKSVDNFDDAANYLEASLLSFQNLGAEEKTEIAAVINQYRRATNWPAALRMMAVGFAFLTIAGEENFDQVIANLKAYLSELNQARSGPAGPLPAGGTGGGATGP